MTTNPPPPIVPAARDDESDHGLIENDQGDTVLDPDVDESSIDSVAADRIASVSPDSDRRDED